MTRREAARIAVMEAKLLGVYEWSLPPQFEEDLLVIQQVMEDPPDKLCEIFFRILKEHNLK